MWHFLYMFNKQKIHPPWLSHVFLPLKRAKDSVQLKKNHTAIETEMLLNFWFVFVKLWDVVHPDTPDIYVIY